MYKPLATAALFAVALARSTRTSGAPAVYCPDAVEDVCYSIAVPERSASSGSGNIYIQLRAPTTYQWIGLGQGSGMTGANMFLLYADGTGNVTVSPRAGTGRVPPLENPNTEIEVLAGSGIVEDGSGGEMMVANFRCGNCDSWAGGQMSLTGTATSWIVAWREGPALNTLDRDAAIQQHDSVGQFTLDLTQATVGEDSNPYVGGRGGGPQNSDSSGDGSEGVGAPANGDGAVTPVGVNRSLVRILTAHWVIMFIVWLILFPLGSVLMPLFGNWIFHATWQSVTFVLMWVGFALGRFAFNRFGETGSTHTNFGTVIVCLMVLQPIGGYMHHRYFLQHKRRGAISHVHIWYGRALMLMGVVNGGLGIRWAADGEIRGSPLMIAYSVVAAGMAVIYLGGKGFGVARRRRRGAAAAEKDTNSSVDGNGEAARADGPRRPFP
ncbi:hypothetical protein DL764_004598 [Monosporascus ibericus]|uniref:DOMON domain-containing protein n=1 Tax=Monosporascus ibericus TaxID=155417 RepID=A0A4Q4TCE0_9PEZI|nr:hypothetical protein DL764_004598 [Monosporascus ibericus]